MAAELAAMSAPTPCDAGALGQMVSERLRGVADGAHGTQAGLKIAVRDAIAEVHDPHVARIAGGGSTPVIANKVRGPKGWVDTSAAEHALSQIHDPREEASLGFFTNLHIR